MGWGNSIYKPRHWYQYLSLKYLSFGFMNPYIKSYKTEQFSSNDLPDIPLTEDVIKIGEHLSRALKKEEILALNSGRQPSLFKAILRVYYPLLILCLFSIIIIDGIQYSASLVIKRIIQDLQKPRPLSIQDKYNSLINFFSVFIILISTTIILPHATFLQLKYIFRIYTSLAINLLWRGLRKSGGLHLSRKFNTKLNPPFVPKMNLIIHKKRYSLFKRILKIFSCKVDDSKEDINESATKYLTMGKYNNLFSINETQVSNNSNKYLKEDKQVKSENSLKQEIDSQSRQKINIIPHKTRSQLFKVQDIITPIKIKTADMYNLIMADLFPCSKMFVSLINLVLFPLRLLIAGFTMAYILTSSVSNFNSSKLRILNISIILCITSLCILTSIGIGCEIFSGYLRKPLLKVKDRRLEELRYILKNIRIIKLLNWEDFVYNSLINLRDEEMHQRYLNLWWSSAALFFTNNSLLFSQAILFLVLGLLFQNFTGQFIIPTIATVPIMYSLSILFNSAGSIPEELGTTVRGWISLSRIQLLIFSKVDEYPLICNLGNKDIFSDERNVLCGSIELADISNSIYENNKHYTDEYAIYYNNASFSRAMYDDPEIRYLHQLGGSLLSGGLDDIPIKDEDKEILTISETNLHHESYTRNNEIRNEEYRLEDRDFQQFDYFMKSSTTDCDNQQMNLINLSSLTSPIILQKVNSKIKEKVFRKCSIFKFNDSQDNFLHFQDYSSLYHLTISPCLKDINLSIKYGQIGIIFGQDESGKTNLLDSIIGSLYRIKGISYIANKRLQLPIQYVSSSTWLPNGTLKSVILAGRKFDEISFRNVLKVCQLETDINNWPLKDLHMIDEYGNNLSNGQKVRVALARALYNYDCYENDEIEDIQHDDINEIYRNRNLHSTNQSNQTLQSTRDFHILLDNNMNINESTTNIHNKGTPDIDPLFDNSIASKFNKYCKLEDNSHVLYDITNNRNVNQSNNKFLLCLDSIFEPLDPQTSTKIFSELFISDHPYLESEDRPDYYNSIISKFKDFSSVISMTTATLNHFLDRYMDKMLGNYPFEFKFFYMNQGRIYEVHDIHQFLSNFGQKYEEIPKYGQNSVHTGNHLESKDSSILDTPGDLRNEKQGNTDLNYKTEQYTKTEKTYNLYKPLNSQPISPNFQIKSMKSQFTSESIENQAKKELYNENNENDNIFINYLPQSSTFAPSFIMPLRYVSNSTLGQAIVKASSKLIRSSKYFCPVHHNFTELSGHVKLNTYKWFIELFYGRMMFTLIISIFISLALCTNIIDIIAIIWSGQDKTSLILLQDKLDKILYFNSFSISLQYMIIFFILTMVTITIRLIGIYFEFKAKISSSIKIHNDVLLQLLKAPIKLYDGINIKSLVDIFSLDLSIIDNKISFSNITFQFTSFIISIIFIVWSTPVFLFLIPIIVYIYIKYIFKPTRIQARENYRLLLNTYGLLCNQTEFIIKGSDIIRTMKLSYYQNYTSYILKNLLKIFYFSYGVSIWGQIRTLLLGIFTIFIIFLLPTIPRMLDIQLPCYISGFACYSPDPIISSFLGLTLSFAIGLPSTINGLNRKFIDLEMDMCSIQRFQFLQKQIEYYHKKVNPSIKFKKYNTSITKSSLSMENDGNTTDSNNTNSSSLEIFDKGSEKFVNSNINEDSLNFSNGLIIKDATMSYTDNRYIIKIALRNINMNILPGQHIGLVGRTGSGKSSLIHSILGIYELDSGQILLDNIDLSLLHMNINQIIYIDKKSTNNINIKSNYCHQYDNIIGFIPQNHVIINNWTIRKYIDPYDQYSDSNIWNAIDELELNYLFKDLPSGLNSVASCNSFSQIMNDNINLAYSRSYSSNDKTICQLDNNNQNRVFNISQIRILAFIRLYLNSKNYRLILIDEPPIMDEYSYNQELNSGSLQDTNTIEFILNHPRDTIKNKSESSISIPYLVNKYFRHCIVIIITHNIESIQYCDYIYVMSHGQISSKIKFSEVKSQLNLQKLIYKANEFTISNNDNTL
ncbi:ABC transporter family protein [Cryptosporidium muris RN66]|uniref:ABC transporter family protein n=1 Tax=Cryptosporidium muris (strain RN66) TaxID=441375 RepID=B6AJT9_CRYMR|nr:ABC transporter family protein [Cryptosporidium muris RN66]EEA08480.1 ABC transporter family protein [Cryptosporidium muris RN66]|eukprot:XP_002142829.1 ABC transporter family protein [Cryptosporidium muris RN66]